MKVNKKLLQQHLSDSTGQVVILKDISNIQTSLGKPDENIETLLATLRDIEGKLPFPRTCISIMYSVHVYAPVQTDWAELHAHVHPIQVRLLRFS